MLERDRYEAYSGHVPSSMRPLLKGGRPPRVRGRPDSVSEDCNLISSPVWTCAR
jgi:hypothetical protein